MKIQFISYDNLEVIKANLKTDEKNYAKPSCSWLNDQLNGALFSDSRFAEVKDFQLDMSAPKGREYETDPVNAKLFYEHFQFLTDSQAADERLWAGLALGPFWEYVQYRWGIKDKPDAGVINERVLFGKGVRRSLMRQALARLWWIARLTYAKDQDDHYIYTNFVSSHNDYVLNILERNQSNNPEIIQPFIQAIMDAQKQGLNVNTTIVGELAKYLNLLGGIYVLDCVPKDRIYQKTFIKAVELNSRPKAEKAA